MEYHYGVPNGARKRRLRAVETVFREASRRAFYSVCRWRHAMPLARGGSSSLPLTPGQRCSPSRASRPSAHRCFVAEESRSASSPDDRQHLDSDRQAASAWGFDPLAFRTDPSRVSIRWPQCKRTRRQFLLVRCRWFAFEGTRPPPTSGLRTRITPGLSRKGTVMRVKKKKNNYRSRRSCSRTWSAWGGESGTGSRRDGSMGSWIR
jgi:hypothetical protein